MKKRVSNSENVSETLIDVKIKLVLGWAQPPSKYFIEKCVMENMCLNTNFRGKIL
jgi:hypothetical protein